MAEKGWDHPEETFVSIREAFNTDRFTVTKDKHSIHDTRLIFFMEKIIGANSFVKDIMRDGLGPDFVIPPPQTFENKNNKSARNNINFFCKKVDEWAQEGFITKLTEKPLCINPMTVATKTNSETGEQKKRL